MKLIRKRRGYFGYNLILYVCIIITLMACNQVDSLSKKAVAREAEEPIEIHVKEFDIQFLPDSCACQMEFLLADSNKLSANILSCQGSMIFKTLDLNGHKIIEGKFANSLDTLVKYSVGISAIDGSRKVYVIKYFEPLPDGVWYFFKDQKLVDSIEYKLGIEAKKTPRSS